MGGKTEELMTAGEKRERRVNISDGCTRQMTNDDRKEADVREKKNVVYTTKYPRSSSLFYQLCVSVYLCEWKKIVRTRLEMEDGTGRRGRKNKRNRSN